MGLAAAGQRRQLARQQPHQGGLAGAIRAQQGNAVTGIDVEIDALQQRGPVIAHGHFVQPQQVVRQGVGLEEGKMERRVGMGGGQLLHALKLADAALGLARLAGLGAETVDEGLDALPLGLLALVGLLLLRKKLGALALEGAVVAGIERQATVVEVQDALRHGVEKVPVVGDEQQGAGVAGQPLLEPHHGLQIEVVGGLVEQEEIGAAHQRASQVEAHAPAAGEVRHRPLLVAGRKTQPVHQARGAGLGAIAVDGVQPFVQPGHLRAVAGPLGCPKLGLQAAQLGIALEHELQRRAWIGRGLLRHLGHNPLGRHLQAARIRLQFATQQPEQAGLAAAVATDDTDPLAGGDLQARPLEQQAWPPTQGQFSQPDHALRAIDTV